MNKVAKVAVAGAVAMVLGSTLSGRLLPGYVAAAAADDAKKDAAKPQVSAAAGKDLQEAQKDMQAQKWDDMLVVLDKVKNNPKKSDYDEHVMNEFYVTAYANKKQLQEATGPLEFLIASKFTPPDELQKRVTQAAFLYYQLQQYDKAVDYGNRAVKDGYATDQVQLVVAQSYYLKNDFKGTGTFVTGLVNDQIKAGMTPTNDMLQLGLSSAVKQNDDAGEAHWLELLVTYHPKAEYWQNLLDPLFRTKMPDRELLQLYRLSADVGNMKHGSDYAEMAQAALDAGSPGEAVAVLNKAFTDNSFADAAEKNRNQHLLETAKKQAAADEPTLAKAEADATAAAGGDKLVGVGIGYFGYGQYDKAVKDIAAGLAKGATKDTENARLLLGIAQFKAGSKDEALKTFGAVKGDASLQRIAALWVLHIKAPAAAAA
jgi:tetratricopeptide (TPR) repeat protein